MEYMIGIASFIVAMSYGLGVYFIRKWINSVDCKFAGLFKRFEDISLQVAEHKGYHTGRETL